MESRSWIQLGFVTVSASALLLLAKVALQRRSAQESHVGTPSTAKYLRPPEVSMELYNYLLEKGTREPDAMRELRLATATHTRAGMMSAPDQQNFTQWLLRTLGAQRAIEIGVFTGYSALATALALGDGGKLVALDISEEFPKVGKPFWEKAGVSDIIDLRIGPGLTILDELVESDSGTFDFAFIDADKKNYINYLERLLLLVRKGGVIAIDNVLWHGKVLDDAVADDDTAAIRKLNELLSTDSRVDIAMIPISDGVTFLRVL